MLGSKFTADYLKERHKYFGVLCSKGAAITIITTIHVKYLNEMMNTWKDELDST